MAQYAAGFPINCRGCCTGIDCHCPTDCSICSDIDELKITLPSVLTDDCACQNGHQFTMERNLCIWLSTTNTDGSGCTFTCEDPDGNPVDDLWVNGTAAMICIPECIWLFTLNLGSYGTCPCFRVEYVASGIGATVSNPCPPTGIWVATVEVFQPGPTEPCTNCAGADIPPCYTCGPAGITNTTILVEDAF